MKFNNYLPPAISAERLNKIENDLGSSLQLIDQVMISLTASTDWKKDNITNSYVSKIILPTNLDMQKKYRIEISVDDSILSKENYQILAYANIAKGILKITSNETIITLYSYGIPPLSLKNNITLIFNIYSVINIDNNTVLLHLPTVVENNIYTDGINSVHYSSSNVPAFMGKYDFWNWGRIGDTIQANQADEYFNNFEYMEDTTKKKDKPWDLNIKINSGTINEDLYIVHDSSYPNLSSDDKKKVLYGFSNNDDTIKYTQIGTTANGLQLFATYRLDSDEVAHFQAFYAEPSGSIKKLNFDNTTDKEFCDIKLVQVLEDTLTIIVKHRNTIYPQTKSETLIKVYDLQYANNTVTLTENIEYQQLFNVHAENSSNKLQFDVNDRYYFGISNTTGKEYCLIREKYNGSTTRYHCLFYIMNEQDTWQYLGKTKFYSSDSNLEFFNIHEGVMCLADNTTFYYIKDDTLNTLSYNENAFGDNNKKSGILYPNAKGFKHIAPNKVAVFYFNKYYFYITPRFETINVIKKEEFFNTGFEANTNQWNAIGIDENEAVIVQYNDSSTLLIGPIKKAINNLEYKEYDVVLGKTISKLNLLNDSRTSNDLALIGYYNLQNENQPKFIPIYDVNNHTIEAYEFNNQTVLNIPYDIYDDGWITYSPDSVAVDLLKLIDYNKLPGLKGSSNYNTNFYQAFQNQYIMNNIYQLYDLTSFWWFGQNKNIINYIKQNSTVEPDTTYRKILYDMSLYNISYEKRKNDDQSEIILGATIVGTEDIDKFLKTPPYSWVKYRNITEFEYNELKGDN